MVRAVRYADLKVSFIGRSRLVNFSLDTQIVYIVSIKCTAKLIINLFDLIRQYALICVHLFSENQKKSNEKQNMASNVDVFDIVLSFDTTGSMEGCLNVVRSKMREMMRKLKSDIPGIRMGVIAHGDYDTDHTYILKHENLTDDVDRLCQFVQNAKGTGGGSAGNFDEAYELALHYTRCKINWRYSSNRVLVMIGDCRPHEYDYFLNKERIDWRKEIVLLRDMV